MVTTVTERGQTAIPAEIRRRYRLKPHTKLVWLQTRKGLTIVPISEDPIRSLQGRFKGKDLVKTFLEARRAERRREQLEDERWIRQHLRH